MIFAACVFVAAYVLMLLLPAWRPHVAVGAAAVFMLSGQVPAGVLLSYVDINVLMMIAGTMGLVSLLTESGMPARMADAILARVPDVRWAVVTLSLFAGAVSALMDNVATVLMIAPIALAVAGRLDISPVGMIIAIAVSSNLQGAATLVGDTTSILLGGYAGMDFLDFFVYEGKPGIFFAVELGAVLSGCLLLWLFRRERRPVPKVTPVPVTDYVPTVLLGAVMVLMIAASLLPPSLPLPSCVNGLICMGGMGLGMLHNARRRGTWRGALAPLRAVDWNTLLLLGGLFILVGGIAERGVVDAVAALVVRLGGGSVFTVYSVILWMSVLLSAFIDNIPYVATMLPVVSSVAAGLSVEPALLYFGLLSGATLGGNLTPIGASANIAGIGILRRAGYTVRNRDFFRIGVPFTLAAILPAYVYFWLFYR